MHNGIYRLMFAFCISFAFLFVSCTHTSPIKDFDGKPLALEVDMRRKLELNGCKQWIYAAGVDEDNPVILWLDGGPGGSELSWVRTYLGPLHKSFTIVCWDQRGTAGSFHANTASLTVEQYVLDVIALSEMLAREFGQEKIYLVGHSWGSVIGLLAAQRRPDLFYAYIAAAQHVNSIENDGIGWQMILDGARREGDLKTVGRMEKLGPPPYTKQLKDGSVVPDGDSYYQVLKRLYHYSPAAPSDGSFSSTKMFLASEHSLGSRINLARGLLRGVKLVYPQLAFLDMEAEVKSLDCPLFLINARYDMSCVASISERWFLKVEAPLKQMVWLENSGHNGVFTEAEAFIAFLNREVRPLSNKIE